MCAATYDTDVTTWSPQGRLYQVEYAAQAVNQGSPVVGLKSEKAVVLVALKRRATELESYTEKLFGIDAHLGVGIAGLNADGRVLHKHMRQECLNHRYVYDAPMNVGRLAAHLGKKAQKATQSASKRPFGVGMLLAGSDKVGVHLYETSPTGNLYDYIATAIGGRSQSARTYLEKHFETFKDCSDNELVLHGLRALTKCLEQDGHLTAENVSVGVCSIESRWKLLSGAEILQALNHIKDENNAGPAPMETS